MATIKFEVLVDDKNATATLQKLGNSLKQTESQVKATSTSASKAGISFGSFGSTLKNTIAPIAATYLSLQTLKNVVMGAVKESMEAERVNKALATTLELTGRGGKAAAEKIQEFASQLQRQTIYGDEAIKSAYTLLAQLTKLDEAGLQKATKAAMGLSSSLGMGLQSAAMLVAKAMEGNVGALSQYGFKIDESLPKQEALNKLLGQLAGLFKRSEEEANTFAGSVTQLFKVILPGKPQLINRTSKGICLFF